MRNRFVWLIKSNNGCYLSRADYREDKGRCTGDRQSAMRFTDNGVNVYIVSKGLGDYVRPEHI